MIAALCWLLAAALVALFVSCAVMVVVWVRNATHDWEGLGIVCLKLASGAAAVALVALAGVVLWATRFIPA